MKLVVMTVIALGVFILAAIITIPFINGDTKGEDIVDKEIMIPPIDSARPVVTETATFGAGCFWGVEAAFRRVKGVTSTSVGYSGGTTENPTYKEVCTDRTGHAEVVRVAYDPSQVSYGQLLGIYWASHDPTQIDRQGPDVGEQYRSGIWTVNEKQQREAEAYVKTLEAKKKRRGKIVTQIEPAAKDFWPAEDYHQDYIVKTRRTCHVKDPW